MNYLRLPRRAAFRLLLLLPVNLVLLAAFAASIWFDNAANRGVVFTPAPQSIPFTDGPRVGVNVFNLHVEPDPAVVRRTLTLVHDMGAGYARMQAPWDDIEIHGRGDFSDRRNDLNGDGQKDTVSAWLKYDRIVTTANELGLDLIMRLERAPDWSRQSFLQTSIWQEGLAFDGNSTGPPDDFADYGRFVQAIVERYDGDGIDDAPGSPHVRFFQIWNEPNLTNEWNWQTPRPEDFVKLLRVGYEAAKSANPDAGILFPSLAPTDGLDARAPMTELEYLDRVYQAGGAAYFDIMSGQAYGLGQPPDENRYVYLRGRSNWSWTQPIDTRNDVSRIVLLREVMERNGDSNKAIWIGEFGWNSAPDTIPPERRLTWGQPVSEEQKAAYIIGQIERARREWPWIGVMNVWMLRYGGYREPAPDDPTRYFALVARDWTPLPAYTQLKDYLAQPTVVGVGMHSWQHPAVEALPNGWRLRFSGTRATLIGGLDGGLEPRLDGTPVTLTRDGINNQQALATPDLPDGLHTLEIIAPGAAPPLHVLVERAPPAPWFWALLPALLLGLLLISSVATTRALFESLDDLRLIPRTRAADGVVMLGLLLGLLIFYRASPQVPFTVLGLLVFAGFAVLRPDLALLFVPLTVPLYFMPKGIWDETFGFRGEGLRLPLHEIVLLVVFGTTLLNWFWQRPWAVGGGRLRWRDWLTRARLSFVAPGALFLLAGSIGVLVVPPEGRSTALREWRWLIVEPLIFYGLLLYHAGQHRGRPGAQTAYYLRHTTFYLLGGAFVGLVGMLQFAGLNLVPLLGSKVGFSEDKIFVEGVRRVSSVYGHPNNLGLFLGRVWPLAAALLLVHARRRLAAGKQNTPQSTARRSPWSILFYAASALLALGGLLVSFSRGAYLGAGAALLVLALLLGSHSLTRRWRLAGFVVGLGLVGGALGLAALLFGIERFNLLGESSAVRVKTWQSALAMLRDHPFVGIGLDQFARLYPRYIDPGLVGTSEIHTAHPHNLFLDITLRLGVLGLLVFGWLIARFYRDTRGPRAEEASAAPQPLRITRYLSIGLAAAMSAALVHGMVDSFYFWPDLAFAFWLMLALAHAAAVDRDLA